MFIEDIKDEMQKRKHIIATVLLITLGIVLSYIIEGDPLGYFTGWWLLIIGVIQLFKFLVFLGANYRKMNKKELLSDILVTILLAVFIYFLYRTIN